MYIPIIVIILIVAWFSWIHWQNKKQLSCERLLKRHYLQMLLLSTKNPEDFFKLLLRKYIVDSRLYDSKPVKEFNDLWIAISDDAEAWTIGSDFIMKKEKVVAPDITEAISEKIFNLDGNKQFLSFAKHLISWNDKATIKELKIGSNYKDHDSFGSAMSEKDSEEMRWLSGSPKEE